MTQLLVSVRSASEAIEALAGGADWIDVKEPLFGSLGAAEPKIWPEVLAAVGDRAPVSVALGEVCDRTQPHGSHHLAGVAMVKYGLANLADDPDWMSRASAAYEELPASCARAAVYYADEAAAGSPPLADVIRWSQHISASAILIDTFEKAGRTLFDYFSEDRLAVAIRQIRAAGAAAACGGSLSIGRIPGVISSGADIAAVRGAVCAGLRTSAIDRQLVRRFKTTLESFRSVSPLDAAKSRFA
ncbi:MAG: (5-formylfuran-3-yl)methyl phosphate synthase [Blastopirellula sp. JB062]